ncbi:hypothetical protein BASA81_015435 [Batrachochytrium salamandrivorans]|nr:hypothetical protein BASA81_015435 [Batrachochytrium salamandrivorans]
MNWTIILRRFRSCPSAFCVVMPYPSLFGNAPQFEYQAVAMLANEDEDHQRLPVPSGRGGTCGRGCCKRAAREELFSIPNLSACGKLIIQALTIGGMELAFSLELLKGPPLLC